MEQGSVTSAWQIFPIADQAIYIDFGEIIDEKINRRVTTLTTQLKEAALTGVTALIPTYRSLTVNYDATQTRQTTLIAALQTLLAQSDVTQAPSRCWHIPVCYGGEYGIDLADFAGAHSMTTEEIIRRHTAASYRVYMIGFMPGFAYLGGLDPQLHTPRRESPRLKVPAGSISIGGMQTAVGSVESPSGWHLLGRTPLRSFDPQRAEPFLLQAGDYVRFSPITPAVFTSLYADRDYIPDWSWQK